MGKNKEKSITIANVIAIIGLALLGVFTFLGHSFLSGGELAFDVLTAVILIAISVAFLMFLIKARKAENDLDKWWKFEMATLVAFVIFALFTGYQFGLGHFFEVNTNKEEIKEVAENDLKNIHNVFSEYHEFESDAISKSCNGLYNSVYSTSSRSEDLEKFMADERFEPTRDGVDAYRRRVERELLGSGYRTFLAKDSVELSNIEQVIQSWSMINLPFQANKMEKVADNICRNLNERSESVNLPLINKNGWNRYTITGYQSKKFELQGGSESLKFKSALKETGNIGATAWFAIILINLLILFPYVTAKRTLILRSKGMEQDGGITIK